MLRQSAVYGVAATAVCRGVASAGVEAPRGFRVYEPRTASQPTALRAEQAVAVTEALRAPLASALKTLRRRIGRGEIELASGSSSVSTAR